MASVPRNEFHEAVDQCLAVLRPQPSGLLTDIDGTISAMARTPDEATVLPLAKEALERLRGMLGLVGVVTGRSASVGESLVGVPGLVYVGNHGMEWIERGTLNHHAEAAVWSDAVRESLLEISAAATAGGFDQGLVFEDKGLSGSVHYRLASDVSATHASLLNAARSAGDRLGLRVTEGRLVLEIRPPVQISKGTALRALVRGHGLRGIVFFGDDVTDVDAFREVRSLRENDGVAGLRVGVLGPDTHSSVRDESDVTVTGVAECAELLAAVADTLNAEADAWCGIEQRFARS